MFSNKNRATILEQIHQSSFDIIVIGGGITGAGVALDTASRGLSVLLLEKNDFASGTSSRSTKLIHGGLRYLKTMEFKMVRDTGREREIVYKNAMHLVYPEKMLLPIIQGGTLGKWNTSFALWLYDFLADVKPDHKKIMLDATQTLQKEPLLKKEKLIGSGEYYEYRTNDARLTVEVVKTAVINYLAKAVNHACVDKFIYDNHKIKGVAFTDRTNGKSYQAFAKLIINAAGPWVDELRRADQSLTEKHIVHSKGVHLVFSKKTLPLKHSVYVELPDKRMIFAIPAQEITYVGTTDTIYHGNIDPPALEKADLEYLLTAVSNVFQVKKTAPTDVLSAWCGVRPLIFKEGKNAGELSRHDEIIHSKSGLVTIAGGKLTGYRLMAEKTLNACSKEIFPQLPDSKTKTMRLIGGDFDDEQHMLQTLELLKQQYIPVKIQAADIESLFYKYGTATRIILQQLTQHQTSIIEAELEYCLDHEMVYTLSDFIYQRTSYALFSPDKLTNDVIKKLLNQIQVYFGLSNEAKEQQEKEFRNLQFDIKRYYPSS